MTSITRATLRKEAAKLLNALLATGTATGGGTTTIVHTGNGGLQDSGVSEYLMAGAYLRIDSGAQLGQWRQITPNGYDPSTGTVTVGSAFAGTVSATSYEILTLFDPTTWDEIINDTLAKLRYRWSSPLTLVTNGDFEDPDTSVSIPGWSGSSTTLSVVTPSSSTVDDFIDGVQALKMDNSVAGGQALSSIIYCRPGQSFHVWADYRSANGTASVKAYDYTNGATIVTATGPDTGAYVESGSMIHTGFTAPSGCGEIKILLVGTESNATLWWDNVIVMASGRRSYRAPSWVESSDQVYDLVTRLGTRPNAYTFTGIQWPRDAEQMWSADQAVRIYLPDGTPRPTFVRGGRKFTAFTADTSTVDSNLEWLKFEVANEALERALVKYDNAAIARHVVNKAMIASRRDALNRIFNIPPARPVGPAMEWVATA